MVLAAVLRLGEGAYGAAVIKEIRSGTGRRVPSGSLSVTLDRLERKGYLESRLGQPDSNRGGRPKRFVAVTQKGLQALREARSAMLSLWSGLERRLDES
ncbi:MAG: helix-turn-helix transcriptional regulator [Gemmatimonadota bacterium]|nr:MAG: helix-turn-helix transcriptional regulator [Gemmatimonadota bacterium]